MSRKFTKSSEGDIMKRLMIALIGISLLMAFAGCKTEAVLEQEDSPEKENFSFEIEPGTRLLYDYAIQGQPDKLDIFIEAIGRELIFKWNIHGRPGEPFHRTVKETALDSSLMENVAFYGSDDTLYNEFSMMFPRNLYEDLIEKDTCLFKPLGQDQDEMTYLVNLGEENFDVLVDDFMVTVTAIHARERVWKNYEYWILKNPESPLILRRISNFDMVLREIETPN